MNSRTLSLTSPHLYRPSDAGFRSPSRFAYAYDLVCAEHPSESVLDSRRPSLPILSLSLVAFPYPSRKVLLLALPLVCLVDSPTYSNSRHLQELAEELAAENTFMRKRMLHMHLHCLSHGTWSARNGWLVT